MAKFRYLTHPQIRLDPAVPVPRWGLNDVGWARVEAFKSAGCLRETKLIISSGETKALETAAIIADHLRIAMHVRDDAHENDRSATGFLPPPEFEKMADAFFASPLESVSGWERAIDAQTRIAKVFAEFAAAHGENDMLMVGHGGVGTLLYCHLANLPIARLSDQPSGGGNVFCFDHRQRIMNHGWASMESLAT